MGVGSEAMEVQNSTINYDLQVANPSVPIGYKQTEVGIIPVDWDCPRIGALGSSQAPAVKAGPFGSSLTKDQYVSDGFKVYGQEQVIRGNYLYGDYFISAKKFRELESCAVRPGDILLSLVGTIGKLLEIPKGAPPGVINPRLLRISLDRQQVLPRFFKYLFESAQVQARLERQAQGGTMGVLNAGVLRPFSIPLPPLFEQGAIAAALSDMDALLDGLDRLIAKKRDLKQAAMQQLLTGQTRLPGFEGEWQRIELRYLVSTAITDGPHMTPKFYENGVPFLSVNNLVDNKIDLTDLRYISKEDDEFFARKCKPRKGDVLLGKAASVGKVAYVDEDFDFNIWSPIALVRPKSTICAKFIYYQLLSEDCISQVMLLTNSSSQGNIGMGDIEKIQILHPEIEEQAAIATVLSNMDAEIAALEQRRHKTRYLKQAMMQELLTGRIRLAEGMNPSEAAG
jgi:type I restriction enzyme S subunit